MNDMSNHQLQTHYLVSSSQILSFGPSSISRA